MAGQDLLSGLIKRSPEGICSVFERFPARGIEPVYQERKDTFASLSKALDLRAQERRSFLRSVPVDEVMSTTLLTVSPQTDLRTAARSMLERKVGCLLVTDEAGGLLGIVTESDLVRAAWA